MMFAVFLLFSLASAFTSASCKKSKPCSVGGSCTKNNQCIGELKCRIATVDTSGYCCLKPGEKYACVAPTCLCGVDEGPCKDDDQCESGLICVGGVCGAPTKPPTRLPTVAPTIAPVSFPTVGPPSFAPTSAPTLTPMFEYMGTGRCLDRHNRTFSSMIGEPYSKDTCLAACASDSHCRGINYWRRQYCYLKYDWRDSHMWPTGLTKVGDVKIDYWSGGHLGRGFIHSTEVGGSYQHLQCYRRTANTTYYKPWVGQPGVTAPPADDFESLNSLLDIFEEL